MQVALLLLFFFFCATNPHAMNPSHAVHCVRARKICYGKNERENTAGRKFHVRIAEEKKVFCLKRRVQAIDK